MLLMNALYFQGSWKHTFDKDITYKADFRNMDGSVSTIDMMRTDALYNYMTGDDVSIIEMPYGNEAFSMVVLLPSENSTVDDIIADLPSNWDGWAGQMAGYSVNLHLPKFGIEFEQELNDALITMGMVDAFNPFAANFRNMNDAANLFLGLVKQ